MTMSLLEEKEAQRNGFVGISYNVGPFASDSFNRSLYKDVTSLTKALPVKISGFHFCFDDIRYRMVWGLSMVFLGKAIRLRSRDHEGSHTECRYGLMSYGIPVDQLPINVEGKENYHYLQKWIEERRRLEKLEST